MNLLAFFRRRKAVKAMTPEQWIEHVKSKRKNQVERRWGEDRRTNQGGIK